MDRNGFVFYKNYADAIFCLPKNQQLDLFWAIINKGLTGCEPEKLSPAARAVWTLIAPQIELSVQRFEAGKKGGRPKKTESYANAENQKPNENQTETKSKPNDYQKPITTKPKRNQTETNTEANGGNIEYRIQNTEYISSSPLPPSETEETKIGKKEEEGGDEREKETEMEPGNGTPPPVQPVDVDVRQVRSLCSKYGVDADEFIASYASRGWTIAGEPIRDMEALIRKCGENAKKKRAGAAAQAPPARQLEQSSFDADEFMLAALRRVYGEDVDYDT